jgi:hypothetical protein
MPNIAARLRRREQLVLAAASRLYRLLVQSRGWKGSPPAGPHINAAPAGHPGHSPRLWPDSNQPDQHESIQPSGKDQEPGRGTRQNPLTGRLPHTPTRKTREHSCVANHWTARDGTLDSLEITGAAPLFGRPGPNSAAPRITPTWRAANSACSATNRTCRRRNHPQPRQTIATASTRVGSAPRSPTEQAQPHLGVLSRLRYRPAACCAAQPLTTLAAKIAGETAKFAIGRSP